MAEDTGQDQGQSQGDDGGQVTKAAATDTGPKNTGTRNTGDADRTVPYHRFQEINQSYKQLQTELDQIRQQQEQAEEERAQKQGEFQKLADKYKTQAQQEKEKRQQVEQSWERERRLNVWVGAAAGVVKPEAVVDAFSMLDEDDFANISDPKNEAEVRRLAETLVERKPYLADGPVGAGSGGSDKPILGNPRYHSGQETKEVPGQIGSDVRMTSSGRMIFPKKNKKAWK